MIPQLDRERVEAAHRRVAGYYDRLDARSTLDDRLVPDFRALLRDQLRPGARVLDVGCGDGRTLLENAERFGEGVGLDNFAPHLARAEEERRRRGVANVSFVEAHSALFPFDSRFAAGSFDLVFSERGPVAGSSINVQAAVWALKPGGTLLTETLGESNGAEWAATGSDPPRRPVARWLDEGRAVLVRSGLDVRLAAEHYALRRFPDVYEWLVYHRAGWGDESPVTDAYLARLQAFADRFCADDGSVEVTEHRVWVGGVKPLQPPQSWEFAFFGEGSEFVRTYLRLRTGG
jgi:SAM-dependent methyltransferase